MTVVERRDAPVATTKFADRFMDWLAELGYTHCFFVAGGNIMHLLDGARTRMTCIPVVHEVAAGVATEYFNEAGGEGRAFALVTAGPGLTNIVTAMAGAYLESRELLVVGGQVKRPDLAGDGLRQRGIQEVDGVALATPVTVAARRIERPVPREEIAGLVERGRTGRPGPVFIEICLDAQASTDGGPDGEVGDGHDDEARRIAAATAAAVARSQSAAHEVRDLMAGAARPVWLIGGGVDRGTAARLRDRLGAHGVPLMTTWNGADRIDARSPAYFGRPNTWGQRAANVILQQADLVVAFGTRLGLQQTGFNWQAFAPLARLVHVDVDEAELTKGHPAVHLPVRGDAPTLLEVLLDEPAPPIADWLAFCGEVRDLLPLREAANTTRPGYVCPYQFFLDLSELSKPDDLVIPCSSGGANSVAMQAFRQRAGQVMITDKGLASMGYGLSGAIGAALAWPGRRTLLVEGDGGFSQNLQELATVGVHDLDLKIFIFANEGYASIRTTQRNYFGGEYLGCDTRTGLGFPDWPALFGAYGIGAIELDDAGVRTPSVRRALERRGPLGVIVPIDPEQTYFPKITSRITADGGMESAPLHLMSPALEEPLAHRVMRHLPATLR